MDKKIQEIIIRSNKERYAYYKGKRRTYNYGIETAGIFSIYRRTDNKLLHQFNVSTFENVDEKEANKITKQNIRTVKPERVYIEFVNNWISIAGMASHYDMPVEELADIIQSGKSVNNWRGAETLNCIIIGNPFVISKGLIAIKVDLINTIVFTSYGKEIGWINENDKTIDWSEQHKSIIHQFNNSLLSDNVAGFTFSFHESGEDYSKRKWGHNIRFVYPVKG
jgi:hypothetical protein